MKFYLLSDDKATKTGLRLAGIDGELVQRSKENFKEAFDRSLTNEEIAVLLITENLKNLMPEYVELKKATTYLPLIATLPDLPSNVVTNDQIRPKNEY